MSTSMQASSTSELGYLEIPSEQTVPVLNDLFHGRKVCRLILENRLHAYILSDPNASQSACSLTVRSGSYANPENAEGLAHFCEHMLFMGSKDFPDQDEYQSYIAKFNGMANAFTQYDSTSYIFSIAHDAFKGALKRFSGFFTAPSFHPEALEKERNAVHQEYVSYKEDDGWRTFNIAKVFANKAHPFSTFDVGSNQTLSQVTQKNIKQWYEKNYSSNLMQVAVISRLGLDALKTLVIESFKNVPDRNLVTFNPEMNILDPSQLGKIAFIKPHLDFRQLDIAWELPLRFIDREKKPYYYVSVVLGDEGENSLLAQLKREGLVEELLAGENEIDRKHLVFKITMQLTERGVKEWQKISERCFQAIEVYRSQLIPDYIFQQRKKIAEIDYQHNDMGWPYHQATNLSTQMDLEPLSTFPEKTSLLNEFDPILCQELFNFLKPSNCLHLLSAPTEETGIQEENVEPWFETPYTVRDVKLGSITPHPAIKFPEKNPFIPEHLVIRKHAKEMSKLIDTDKAKIYFGIDTQFHVPKSYATFILKSPLLNPLDPVAEIYSKIYVKILRDQIRAKTYRALEAGLRLRIARDKEDGIEFQLHEYLNKSEILLKFIVEKMANFSTEKEAFERHLSGLMLKFRRYKKKPAGDVAEEMLSEIRYPGIATLKQKYMAKKGVSFEGFVEFAKKLWQKAFLNGVVYGNLKESKVIALSQTFEQLQYEAYSNHFQYGYEKVANSPTIVRKKHNSKENAMILNIHLEKIAYNESGLEKLAFLGILDKILEDKFFAELRTEQQTGYYVMNNYNDNYKMLSLEFHIHSGHYTSDDLLHRTERFIEVFLSKLDSLEDFFNNTKTAIVDKMSCPPENLYSLEYRYQYSAKYYDADFSMHDRKINAYKKITFDKFVSYAKEYLSQTNSKRMAFLVDGKPEEVKSVVYKEKKHSK